MQRALPAVDGERQARGAPVACRNICSGKRERAAWEVFAAITTGEAGCEALARPLAEFGPLWDHLVVGERCQLLRLLLETVTYDARTDELGLRFRPAGIRVLASEAGRSA
ncbi:MAG: hypothetical protein IT458_14000 [Planctomycetes bacterium]|nr:hypothetical protein [Planctomycetota bacterium]